MHQYEIVNQRKKYLALIAERNASTVFTHTARQWEAINHEANAIGEWLCKHDAQWTLERTVTVTGAA